MIDQDVPPTQAKGTSGSGKPDETKPPMPSKGQSGEPRPNQAPSEEPKDGQGKPEEKPGEQEPGDKLGENEKGEKPGDAPMGEQPGDKPGDKPEGSEGEGGAGDQPAGPTREELEQKQRDIALTAYELQKAVEKLQGLSELAKQRLTDATKGAENVENALARGQSEEAAKEAGKTAGMFKELARNVEGLLAEETARQVAMARDISDELSDLERELADELERRNGSGSPMEADSDTPGAGQKPGEKKSPKGSGQSQEPGETGQGGTGEPLEDRATELAETGKTLKDILNAIARSDEPADQEAARAIGTLLQEGKLEETIERMQGLIGEIREKEDDAGMAAAAVADNLESAARELDSLHRQIVAPRVADLMKLEQEATELAEMLDNLETEREITDWHVLTDELLADLEKAGLTAQEIDELREAMQEGGWGPDAKRNRNGGWGWAFDRTRYGAPVVYTKAARKLVEKLQSHIQELVLRDMLAAGDEAAPPEYERQIEKYYELLSTEKK
jgi:hypothetical protein